MFIQNISRNSNIPLTLEDISKVPSLEGVGGGYIYHTDHKPTPAPPKRGFRTFTGFLNNLLGYVYPQKFTYNFKISLTSK